MKTILSGISLSIFLLSSCASIIHGPTQTVDFSSQPTGATIIIDGKEYGKTPHAIELRRKGREKDDKSQKQVYDVQIELDRYYPYDLKVKREMDGWFLGNVLIGGLIGIIIDASNGSMYKLTPDQIIAQMDKLTAMNNKTEDDTIYLAVTLTADPNWQKVGQLNKID
ncbi:MAG: PEGA domain-containing protein [Reichenbachiella sp.]|uniref:PEGA domain-containing protein n=1 Tax=Reichenbachiella sp. TaxID=2184521 RepID=UPI003265EB04